MVRCSHHAICNIEQMNKVTWIDLTIRCKEYSNAVSRNCLKSFLAVAISVLNDMPGSHAGSFGTESRLKFLYD